MNESLIINARIITPERVIPRGWISFGGHIKNFGSGEPPTAASYARVIDAKGLTLLPGFIDVHVHGGAGAEAMDATVDALHTMSRFYAQHGVTSYLATTWTDTTERILAALDCVSQYQQGFNEAVDSAIVWGAHVEGPYINENRGGAQNTNYIRRADRAEAERILASNVVNLMALAPEFEENHWLIRECVKRGITISAAHTAATYEQMQTAVQMGITHATHTCNAMTGLNHRVPGTLGAVLTMPSIRAELIADNIHVHPAMMDVIWRCKGKDGVILITDAIRAAGMPDGEYHIDERTITVKDGAARLPDGTLAGSILTMDRALKNFMDATGEPLENVWQTTSLNAARAIGKSSRSGSIEKFKSADLVLVDDDINVYYTIVGGTVVYEREKIS